MKIAIIGSRKLKIDNFADYIKEDVTEIVSGGACGIDTCAKEYAISKCIKYTEFLPEYNRFGRYAPLKRNILIIEYSDKVMAFWDGKSKGTAFVINECKKKNKPCEIILIDIDIT